MKIQEIRELSDEELHAELERLRRHLFDLRAQAVTEKLEDPSMLKKTRRDIARILTVLREYEMAAGALGERKET
ncbi:MAG: 50S ribosomal protein L29 [Planctomycetales bacterium 4484_123]|nr:MAG: 50S ribosomal protein L29 [Planctomycetales bacterium 4484_123]